MRQRALCCVALLHLAKDFHFLQRKGNDHNKVISHTADDSDKGRVVGMLQFSLGLMAGIMMGVFFMCLMIMAGRGPEPPMD